jgi:hypothetical protein
MMESFLVTPPVCLYENSTLTFWHRMEAEASDVYPYWAEDAAVVEISMDGGETWTIISPAGYYPCRASSYNTIFLPSYQRCFSGTIGWKQETFDLSAWRGPALIRFHFASNEQYGFEGWYIDDISITTESLTGEDDPVPAAGNVTRLMHSWPNPFNPHTRIPFEIASRGHVEIKIFDVSGRLVRTLYDGIADRGTGFAEWNGKDNRGKTVASGVYFCRFRAGVYTATERLVLLR